MKLSIKNSCLFLLLFQLTINHHYIINYERSDYAPLAITYLPEKLKTCIKALYKIKNNEKCPELENLCYAIQDNHAIVTQDIARKGTEQALILLKKYAEQDANNVYLATISNYLTTYLKGLSNEGSHNPTKKDISHAAISDNDFYTSIDFCNEYFSCPLSKKAHRNDSDSSIERGPRGHRGHRGHKGHKGQRGYRGATGSVVRHPEISAKSEYREGGVIFTYPIGFFNTAPIISLAIETAMHSSAKTYSLEISANNNISTTIMAYKIESGIVTEAATNELTIHFTATKA